MSVRSIAPGIDRAFAQPMGWATLPSRRLMREPSLRMLKQAIQQGRSQPLLGREGNAPPRMDISRYCGDSGLCRKRMGSSNRSQPTTAPRSK